MFEAQVEHGSLWKKLIECITEMVTEANFDCSPGGISIQAMDTSHVALVHLLLIAEGFVSYSCEHNSLLGVNMTSLAKVLKITENQDKMTLRHETDSDVLVVATQNSDQVRVCEHQMKLKKIEAFLLDIPEMDYRATVSFSSAEYAKIVRDMYVYGDTVNIQVDREGVKFSSSGAIGKGFVLLRVSGGGARPEVVSVKSEAKRKNDGVMAEAVDDDEAPLEKKVKREPGTAKGADGEGGGGSGRSIPVEVCAKEPVSLSFALLFLNMFAKGAALSDRVTMSFAKDTPCMVEFKLEGIGFLRYYLAPKEDVCVPPLRRRVGRAHHVRVQ